MSTSASEAPRPVEIGRANEYDVKIRWSGGEDVVYPARLLRMSCPCAVCVDELTGVRRLKESSVAQDIHPTRIDPVGHYAIQIYWSDAHSSGIYTWEKLYALIGSISGPPAQ